MKLEELIKTGDYLKYEVVEVDDSRNRVISIKIKVPEKKPENCNEGENHVS